MARTNWRTVAHHRLMPLLRDTGYGISTPSPDDICPALEELLFRKRCNVLAVNGGDGTIHHVLNACIKLMEAAKEQLGEGKNVALPTFLFLNGGGMNMLARVFNTKGHPLLTYRRYLRRARGGRLGTLPSRPVHLLRIREEKGAERYGFVFGSELILNALTMYERFGQGYRGLGRFLYEALTAYRFKTQMWHRFRYLLEAPVGVLEVDGVRHDDYTCVLASTIPMTLLRGLIATLPRMPEHASMDGIIIKENQPERLIPYIPSLMMGKGSPGILPIQGMRTLRLQGPYTLDGELFVRPKDERHESLVVEGSEKVIRGVWFR
jgi:hypothetical protein